MAKAVIQTLTEDDGTFSLRLNKGATLVIHPDKDKPSRRRRRRVSRRKAKKTT